MELYRGLPVVMVEDYSFGHINPVHLSKGQRGTVLDPYVKDIVKVAFKGITDPIRLPEEYIIPETEDKSSLPNWPETEEIPYKKVNPYESEIRFIGKEVKCRYCAADIDSNLNYVTGGFGGAYGYNYEIFKCDEHGIGVLILWEGEFRTLGAIELKEKSEFRDEVSEEEGI